MPAGTAPTASAVQPSTSLNAITSTTAASATSATLNVTADNASLQFAATLPGKPEELGKRQLVVVIIIFTGDAAPTPAVGTPGSAENAGPDDLVLRLDAQGRAILARGPWELATLNAAPPFALESGTWMAAPLPSALPPKIPYWLVANGNSAGEAFELQIWDIIGQFKKALLPEGLVLEPAAPPQKAPKQAGNMLKQPVGAVCLEEAKLPPAQGMLYKIAEPAIQQQYKAVRYLQAALRKRAAEGKLNPDSAIEDYVLFLQQYITWVVLEGWNQQQFTEHWIERTKKSAQAMRMAWTPQMEDTLRAAAVRRWEDITRVREEAESMMRNESAPGQ